jgi:hypothetical protein
MIGNAKKSTGKPVSGLIAGGVTTRDLVAFALL